MNIQSTSLPSTPYNPITGTVYQGMNIGALMSANSKCLEWATFIQWRNAGYKVKKGSKGTAIRTFAETTVKDKQTGKLETGHAPRYYVLFNKEQVEKQDAPGQAND